MTRSNSVDRTKEHLSEVLRELLRDLPEGMHLGSVADHLADKILESILDQGDQGEWQFNARVVRAIERLDEVEESLPPESQGGQQIKLLHSIAVGIFAAAHELNAIADTRLMVVDALMVPTVPKGQMH